MSIDDREGGLAPLLQPSLRDEVAVTSLYSPRANFIVSFLGGPYAAIMMSYLNTRRLGRVRADAWLYALLALAWTVAILTVVATHHDLHDLRSFGRTPFFRAGVRATGLAFCGMLWLRLRRFYVADQVAGEDSPSPWKAGILIVLVSLAATIAVAMAGFLLS